MYRLFSNITLCQVALIPWRYHGNLGIDYSLVLNSIRVPGLNNNTYSGFNQCYDQPHRCFTDSGDSSISLPLPQNVCDEIWNTFATTDPDTLKKSGSLLLDLQGVNGSTVTLSLPLFWVWEQIIAFRNVICTGTSGVFVLGLPIYQYYYLVYDMGNNTVTFVDLPLSNETEAFFYPTSSPSTSKSSRVPSSQPSTTPSKSAEPSPVFQSSTLGKSSKKRKRSIFS